jgi:hypothetical protein
MHEVGADGVRNKRNIIDGRMNYIESKEMERMHKFESIKQIGLRRCHGCGIVGGSNKAVPKKT